MSEALPCKSCKQKPHRIEEKSLSTAGYFCCDTKAIITFINASIDWDRITKLWNKKNE